MGGSSPLAARAVAKAHCAEELETPVSLVGVEFETRGMLLQSAEQGLVAVRYEGQGCQRTLDVIETCHHPARYVFEPRYQRASRIMRSARELRVGLSLASERLLAHLDHSGGLRADVVSVGRLAAPRRLELERNLLAGEGCGRATHVVREIRLGGFSLTTGPIVKLEDAPDQFMEPSPDSSIRELDRDGDPPTCARVRKAKARFAGCDGGVAVDLLPLVQEKEQELMVAVPGGELNKLYVKPFEIDRIEVTVAAYQKCVADRKCSAAGRGPLCTAGVPGRERHPVNCVSFKQAKKYCMYVKKRLPTESEWAVAAGAGSKRRFVWGDVWPPPNGAVNLADETTAQVRPHWTHVSGYMDGFATTAPVGMLPGSRSIFRLADLAGNVQEWVNKSGPRGSRVVRGASFGHGRSEQLEVGRRSFYLPKHTSAHVGFRCARSSGS